MADTKVSALTSATPVATDELYLVDDPGGTPSSKRSTVQSVLDLVAADTQTLTNKTFDANGTGNSLSNVETADIASGSKSGADAALITGTAGTSGNLGEWNADGDMVDGPTPPTGTIVGTTDTQTLTNKTIDGDNNTLSNLDIGNEVDWAAAADVTDRSAFASGDKLIIFEAGVGLRKVDYDDLPGAGGGLSNIVEDTTPQLGGSLDVNANSIVSTANGNITLAPNGTGDVVLGNYTLDADATVGAGQDNYVLTYDHTAGKWGPEAVAAAGDSWGDAVDADIVPDADGTRDVGSATNRFANIHVDSIDLNGTTIDGTTLADPAADALMGWDDSASETIFYSLGAGLTTSTTTVSVDTTAIASLSDLASTANGDGAALIGIEDSGAIITATTVEGALAEIQSDLDTVEAALPSGAVVGTTDTQTLTNKTLTSPKISHPITTDADNYTLVAGDQSGIIIMSGGSGNTLTIPTNASVAFPTGTKVEVWSTGAGTTTIAGDTGVTLQGNGGSASAGSCDIQTQYGGATLTKIDTNVWNVGGDIDTVA